MRPVLWISAAVLVGVAATWVYRVNYAAQSALDRVVALEREIAREREALEVLSAEWAYLNRPARMRALVEAQGETLALSPLAPEQFGAVARIAYPPEPDPPATVAPAAMLPGAGHAEARP